MTVCGLMRIVLVGCSLIAIGGAGAAQPVERPLRMIAANAVKDGLQQLTTQYERQFGHRVEIVWSGTEATARRIAAGERFDAVLIGGEAIDRLVAAGHLAPDVKVAVARTGVAVAVRNGYPPPVIDSADALRAALLAAPRVAYSAGPSGVYIESLIVRLGLGEQVAAKLTRPSSGAEVAQLVARRVVDLAFAQVSELVGVAEIQSLGPLPPSLQNYTIYVAASGRSDVHPQTTAWLRFLTSPQAREAIEAMGMEQP